MACLFGRRRKTKVDNVSNVLSAEIYLGQFLPGFAQSYLSKVPAW